MSAVNMSLLYRNILKSAARFPSIKRDGIIKDIKLEFRANKACSLDADIGAMDRTTGFVDSF